MESEQNISLLVKDIISKKELANLNEDFVLEKLNKFLKENKKVALKLAASDYNKFKRSREHDLALKALRAELRAIYGVFIMGNYAKRLELLKQLKNNPGLESHNKILALHKSSNERLPYYAKIYEEIFAVTGKPKKIVDLACGLNPISYCYLSCTPAYVACDLAEKDLEFIRDYFSIMKIDGTVKIIDLMRDDVSNLTAGADITFLFKALDSLESIKRNSSHRLLNSLNSRYIVVSFATMSIGGKKEIRKERRAWFERMIERLGIASKAFEVPGEIFYVLKKKQIASAKYDH